MHHLNQQKPSSKKHIKTNENYTNHKEQHINRSINSYKKSNTITSNNKKINAYIHDIKQDKQLLQMINNSNHHNHKHNHKQSPYDRLTHATVDQVNQKQAYPQIRNPPNHYQQYNKDNRIIFYSDEDTYQKINFREYQQYQRGQRDISLQQTVIKQLEQQNSMLRRQLQYSKHDIKVSKQQNKILKQRLTQLMIATTKQRQQQQNMLTTSSNIINATSTYKSHLNNDISLLDIYANRLRSEYQHQQYNLIKQQYQQQHKQDDSFIRQCQGEILRLKDLVKQLYEEREKAKLGQAPMERQQIKDRIIMKLEDQLITTKLLLQEEKQKSKINQEKYPTLTDISNNLMNKRNLINGDHDQSEKKGSYVKRSLYPYE